MCHYITGILAGYFDLDAVNRIAEQFSIAIALTQNRSVEKHLNPDERYFYMKRGCACGTDLCSFVPEQDRIKHRKKEEARLRKTASRKKGWSKTKIERWLEEKMKDSSSLCLDQSPGVDCTRWSEFFKRLFNETGVTKAGILLHWHDHTFETEDIHDLERIVLSREKLTAETLFRMKEDTLTIFVKK